MSTMRAKFRVTKVENHGHGQEIELMAVTSKPFDADGVSEDNSFARWTPMGELKMFINNPALRDALKVGEAYYLDFSRSDE